MSKQFIQKLGRVCRTRMRRVYNAIWHLIPEKMYRKHIKLASSLWYGSREGHLPNFKHPVDFNERLMVINYNAYFNEEQRQIRKVGADKYAVRQLVKDKGYGDILNEIYGVYGSFDEIDFDKLPDQFVLKLTNGSGYNYICLDKSKLDKTKLRNDFERWQRGVNEEGFDTGEWHYSQIDAKIIAEKYLSMLGESVSLVDYKFHCINQRVYGEYVCYDRDNTPGAHSVNYDHYDADWNLTDGVPPQFHLTQRPIAKPKRFEEMKKIAEALSEGVEYVRVDLYEIDGKILFGELTYTPMGNYLPYTHERLVDMEQFYEATKVDKK